MSWLGFGKKSEQQEDVDVLDAEAGQDEKDTAEDEEEIDLGGISFGEEISPEDGAKTLNKKAILGGIGIAAFLVVTAISSNHFSSQAAEDKPLGNHGIASAATPADQLPEKYSEIDKEKQKNQDKGKPGQQRQVASDARPPVQVNNARTVSDTQPVNRAPAPQGNGGSSAASAAEKKAAKEAEAVNDSALAFQIAAAVSRGESPASVQPLGNAMSGAGNQLMMTAMQSPNYGVEDYGNYYAENRTSYILNAGAVIQATLLTGITSDVPNGDVVAQVRQNIYDSLTGTHLLIPQGSKIIGKSGSAGGLGNERIGVKFYRIILPNGSSLMLPDQQAIDGTGYPGLADKYTEHSGRLYRTAFLSALFAAAAQSATGNTSGDDKRSPGQEAVAGAVASILNTGGKLVDRYANISPTIEIEPGFQFSVFVNQDLAVGEYHAY